MALEQPKPQSNKVKHARMLEHGVLIGIKTEMSLTAGNGGNVSEMELHPAGVLARCLTKDKQPRAFIVPYGNLAFIEMEISK